MQNREVYEQDPKEFQLLNNGVAKVRDADSSEELETLRFELKTFICEGQYEKGLVRLLQSYLDHLGDPEQPAAWISGFFGSGKSHLVKMLRYLWVDYTFPDGARARGLANLSPQVEDLLKELSTAGRRRNGLHAVSGTLGSAAKGSIRLGLLGLIFKSAGLPEQYPLAQFVMWLKQEGMYEALRERVEEEEGRDWRRELHNLMVSKAIAKHLRDLEPTLGNDIADVHQLLRETYPQVDDVSLDDMVTAIQDALAPDGGELPCTLIALDEIQQFIGEDSEKTYEIQEITQACCSEFGGKLLFVGTGQTALTGAPELEKLTGRYRIQIQLSDADVQAVTRKTVLKKKTSKRPDVEDVLTKNSGEISRHLSGTQFEQKPEDRDHLVDDYPILPTRRRFWERVLRAVDEAGTKSQLRTQLKLVDEAVKETAEDPLGTVVAGDFIYEELRPDLTQSDVLPQDIDNRIETLRAQEDDALGARLCALAFLIGKLPREEGSDTGLRATPETFADLLVQDLKQGSGTLRDRVEERLDALVKEGILMRVEGEYRMQTQESQEWTSEFQKRYRKITKNREQLATHRADELRTAANDALDDVQTLKHGESNEPRDIRTSFSREAPEVDGEQIPVWVRNEWQDPLSSVEADARKAGTESPMIFVFLPKHSADELDKAIATERAAKSTIEVKGRTTTREGQEARQAMVTRRENAAQRKQNALADVLDGARVFLAGGEEYVDDALADGVQSAAVSALERLYPEFEVADNPRWHRVLSRAQDGDTDALDAIDFNDNPEEHPVCKAVLNEVKSRTSGREVREALTAPPRGWPRDAIHAALVLLTLTSHVRARKNGEALDADDLTHRTIGTARFRAETVTLSHRETLAVRNLLQTLTDVSAGDELEAVPAFLQEVRNLADRASGQPPLPPTPDLDHVDEITRHSGNEQLAKLHEYKDRLLDETDEWQTRADRKRSREREWSQLNDALRKGRDIADMESLRTEADAIREQRTLLDETDPVQPLLEKATDLLREELRSVHDDYRSAYEEQMEALEDAEPWQEIADATRKAILRRYDLEEIPDIEVGTTSELLDTLNRIPLDGWRTRIDALPQRFDNALSDAVQELEPETVRVDLPSRVLKSEDDVEEWLDEARETLLDQLKDGPVQV